MTDAADHGAARRWAKRLGRVGLWSFDLERMTAAAEQRYATEAEALGFRALWIPESLGSKEVFAHVGLLLAATGGLVLASGIANIWARDPVAMANGARTLAEAYPGRFLLGIGVSHAGVVEIRGQHYERPLAHMRHYLEGMDKAPFVGAQPAEPTPRVLAALGPQMLTLAAERAIGAHPYFVPVEHTPFARKTLGEGPLLAVEQAVALVSDPVVAREVARRHTKRYLALPNYTNNLRRLGFGDADLAGDGSDRLVDAIVAWGDAALIRRRVEAHLAGGADHVCIQVLRADLAADPLRELRELAPVMLT